MNLRNKMNERTRDVLQKNDKFDCSWFTRGSEACLYCGKNILIWIALMGLKFAFFHLFCGIQILSVKIQRIVDRTG